MAHQPTSQDLPHLDKKEGARFRRKAPKSIRFDHKIPEIAQNIVKDTERDGTMSQTFIISPNPILQFTFDMTEAEYSQNGGDTLLKKGVRFPFFSFAYVPTPRRNSKKNARLRAKHSPEN